jgi:hypothetical protein
MANDPMADMLRTIVRDALTAVLEGCPNVIPEKGLMVKFCVRPEFAKGSRRKFPKTWTLIGLDSRAAVYVAPAWDLLRLADVMDVVATRRTRDIERPDRPDPAP